jgi:biopolymer transport protein ExbD
MLDMTFQLLFFFLLNYHPSALEGQVNMALPPDRQSRPAADVGQAREGNDPEEAVLPADLTVQVRTQHDWFTRGEITQLTVVGRDGPKEVRDLESLQKELQAAREGGNLTNKEDIRIQGDSDLKWGNVVQVLDVCSRAGFRPGFAPPPDRGVGQP